MNIHLEFPQRLLDSYLSQRNIHGVQELSLPETKEFIKVLIKDFRECKISLDNFALICHEIWHEKLNHEEKFTPFGTFVMWLADLLFWVRNPSSKDTVENIIKDAYQFLEKDIINF